MLDATEPLKRGYVNTLLCQPWCSTRTVISLPVHNADTSSDRGNAEWDKKAKKAHVRKLKSKGKEDDTQKGNPRQPRGSVHNPPSSDCDSGESETEDEAEKEKPEEEGTRQKTLGENTTADPTSLAESGDGGDSHAGSGDGFSKRKVHSNAWRYEEEESEFPLTRGQPSDFGTMMDAAITNPSRRCRR